MKKSIGITMVLVLLALAGYGRQALEGVWVNDRHQKKISIHSDRGELFVYGVYPSYERGQRFFRSSRNKYRDRFGNVVKVESDNLIEIKYAEKWRKIEFRKIANQPRDFRSKRQDRSARGVDPRGNSQSTRHQTIPRHSGGLLLEGTYYNADLGKDLYLVEDRNGFKITFKSGDWKYFEKVERHRYRDSKGNTYTVNPDGSLTWFSHSGDRRYTIEKTSSTIPW